MIAEIKNETKAVRREKAESKKGTKYNIQSIKVLKYISNTRCILHCTELFWQSPSSLKVQSSLYWFFKFYAVHERVVDISLSEARTLK